MKRQKISKAKLQALKSKSSRLYKEKEHDKQFEDDQSEDNQNEPQDQQETINQEQEQSNLYEPSDENEDLKDYKVDGYHPVFIGENYNQGKYVVIQKLGTFYIYQIQINQGWGYFSTVWLIQEKNTNNYFAMKVQKSKKSYLESAIDEIEILQSLHQKSSNKEWEISIQKLNEFISQQFKFSDTMLYCTAENYTVQYYNAKQLFNNFLRMYDNFFHYGIHGKHQCSIFEILGPNLLDLISHYDDMDLKIDLNVVKSLARQILIGFDYIHRICGIIHTDLKPENIMIQLPIKDQQQLANQLKKYEKKTTSQKFLDQMHNTKKCKTSQHQKKKLKKKLKKLQQQQQKDEFTNDKIEQQIQIQDQEQISQTQNVQLQYSKEQINISSTQQQIDKIGKQLEQISLGEYLKPPQILYDEANPQYDQEYNKEEIDQKDDANITQSSIQDPNILIWKDHIKIPIDENIKIKIVDFGNACWVQKHFTDNIQTREYRSPEAILGYEYGPNTDIFSCACMIYELITNDFLFKPKKKEGKYGKNDDHLALMIETIEPINLKMPKNIIENSKNGRKYFNKNGQLLNIKNLKEYSISKMLQKYYSFNQEIALDIEQFLLPMLQLDPQKRIQANEALLNKWLWT